jgi:hypothetical protein
MATHSASVWQKSVQFCVGQVLPPVISRICLRVSLFEFFIVIILDFKNLGFNHLKNISTLRILPTGCILVVYGIKQPL